MPPWYPGLCLLTVSLSNQAATWLDQASVVAVEKETVIHQAPLEERRCRRVIRRQIAPAGLPGADIRRQVRSRWRRCTWRHSWYRETQVRGYWVTYEYLGHRYRAFHEEAPGDSLQVRVTIEPLGKR